MMKLKILILSDYAFPRGGAERVAISSAVGLSEKGHEVVYFSAVGPVDKELREAGIKKIICLDQKDILDNPHKFKAVFSGICNRKAIRSLKELLPEWRPDIVHTHGLSKALSWAPINLFYSLKIPVVYTLHDYGLLCPNLGIYNFKTGKACPYYKPGCGFRCMITDCDKRNYAQKLWRWARFFIVRNIFKTDRKVSAYIAVSRFMEEIAVKYLAGGKPVRVIYNPVECNPIGKDTEPAFECNPVEEGRGLSVECSREQKEITTFLYVGRLSTEKGIDLLLEAISGVDAGLTIIGDGELMGMCREYAGKLGNDRIRILGYQDKKRIFSEMQKSSALILPSRCMEPAPLVPSEAAYNCLPSIVAGHGGIPEFVKDGASGLYFEPGSSRSLKESMEKIIRDPELAQRMGQKAREMVIVKNPGIESHTDKLEKYYADILDC